jgi:4-methyl-5(b-hydroxyethyl)-thiazole monophosphate biosynthesis
MESVVIVDTLRRAGWEVSIVAAGGDKTVECSRGVKITADVGWAELSDPEQYDIIVIPGGTGGTDRLREHTGLLELIRRFDQAGKYLAAICAGPLVLQAAGILAERRATSHPGARQQLTSPYPSDERVVVDGRIVTSQGPGTAIEFALKLIELIDGPGKAIEISRAMVAG